MTRNLRLGNAIGLLWFGIGLAGCTTDFGKYRFGDTAQAGTRAGSSGQSGVAAAHSGTGGKAEASAGKAAAGGGGAGRAGSEAGTGGTLAAAAGSGGMAGNALNMPNTLAGAGAGGAAGSSDDSDAGPAAGAGGGISPSTTDPMKDAGVCNQLWPSDADATVSDGGPKTCDLAGMPIFATGEEAANWFGDAGCGTWKIYPVTANVPITISTSTDMAFCSGCVRTTINYAIEERVGVSGPWMPITTRDPPDGFGVHDSLIYMSPASEIRISALSGASFYIELCQ